MPSLKTLGRGQVVRQPRLGGVTGGLELYENISNFISMYYVYILKSCVDHKLYIGQTSNVEKRLERHNNRKVPATRHRCPFELVISKTFKTRSEAMKMERLLKRQKGGDGFNQILQRWGVAKW